MSQAASDSSDPRGGEDQRAPFRHWLAGYTVVFLAMTIAHAQILTAPPYDDFACVFTEAVWLSENNFDIVRLRNEELPFRRGGGPAIYLTSAVTPFFALLIKYGPGNPANLVIAHLVMIAFGSGILVLVFALLRHRFQAPRAVLLTGLLATHPLFNAQVEMLGLDVPMTAFAMLAIYLAARDRVLAACLAAAAAFWMKPTGQIAGVAVAIYCLARFLTSPRPLREGVRFGIGFLVGGMGIALEFLALRWSDVLDELRQPVFVKLASCFPVFGVCPDLPIALLGAVAAFGLAVGVEIWRGGYHRPGNQANSSPIRSLANAVIVRDGVPWMCAFVILGVLYGIFFQVRLPVPRYFLLAAAATTVLFGYVLATFRSTLLWLAVPIAMAVNLANLDGRLYPSTDRLPCPRIGAIWERSLEYRRDLWAVVDCIRAIREKAQGAVVVAPHHITHALALPPLGYTDSAIPGFAASEYTRPGFPPVSLMMRNRPRDVVFVSVDSACASLLSYIDIPSWQSGDESVFDERRNHPLVAVRKRLPASPAEYDRWCLENLWYGREVRLERSLVPLLTRAELLDAAGRSDLADRLLQMKLDRKPEDWNARLDLAEQHLWMSRKNAARAIVDHALAERPDSARALALSARIQAKEGRFRQAIELVDRATQLEPEDAAMWYWKGLFESRLGEWGQSARSLAKSLKLDSWRSNALVEASVVAIRQDRLSDAADYLARACRIASYQPNLHYVRAAVLEHLGRSAQATKSLQAAARQDPKFKNLSRPLPDPRTLIDGSDALKGTNP